MVLKVWTGGKELLVGGSFVKMWRDSCWPFLYLSPLKHSKLVYMFFRFPNVEQTREFAKRQMRAQTAVGLPFAFDRRGGDRVTIPKYDLSPSFGFRDFFSWFCDCWFVFMTMAIVVSLPNINEEDKLQYKSNYISMNLLIFPAWFGIKISVIK